LRGIAIGGFKKLGLYVWGQIGQVFKTTDGYTAQTFMYLMKPK